MRHSDLHRFAAAMAELGAAFCREIEPAMAKTYFDALRDIDLDLVLAACARAVRECEFFPRPVHLRKLAGGQDEVESAVEAFHAMVRIVYGPHGPHLVKQAHPDNEIANEAMRLLGPMAQMADWEGPWAEKRFTEIYQDLQDRQKAGRALGPGGETRLTDGR